MALAPAPSSTASAPFDRADANVILRSADAVDFLAHKDILAVASPVFDDVLALPQPAHAADQDVHPVSGLPVVPVAEDSVTLDRMLRFVYPVPDPILPRVSDVATVLAAALKYDMEEACIVLKKLLLGAVETEDPLEVYAVACRLGLEQVAKAAAVAVSVRQDISYTPEMDQMSSGEFYRLLHFRRMKQRNSAVFAFSRASLPRGGAGPRPEPEPAHPFVHPTAEIILQAADGVHFHVFRNILALASPTFRDILAQRPATDDISSGGLRIVHVSEESQTLSRLLQLCYPMEQPDIENFDIAHTVLSAAMKYKIPAAAKFARKKWVEHMDAHPLRAYFVAMRHKFEEDAKAAKSLAAGQRSEESCARELAQKWEGVARDAAVRAVYQPHDLYTTEMEDVSARVYHRLLEYRQHCREVISSVSVQFGFPEYNTKHWSAFDHGVDPAYDQFLMGVHSQVGTTKEETPYTMLAAPVVERAISFYSTSNLKELIQDSQRLQTELQRALSQVELCVS